MPAARGTSHAVPDLAVNLDGTAATAAAAADEALVSAWREGDVEAGETLLRRYLPLLRAIVAVQTTTAVTASVLVQEGMIGLISTLFRFDPATPFSTAAAFAIAQRVQRVVDEAGGREDR